MTIRNRTAKKRLNFIPDYNQTIKLHRNNKNILNNKIKGMINHSKSKKKTLSLLIYIYIYKF